jgi:hypothetical protein
MRSNLAALMVLALIHSAPAHAAAPAVRAEIDALLGRLLSSDCQFFRNGSWHAASEAKAHLLRKLEYLEARDAVKSTEQFIQLGASSSSTSGKPYLVKCGASAPMESKAWLSNELQSLRAPAAGARCALRR